MKRRILLSVMATVCFALPAMPAQKPKVDPPPLPYVDEGACPFEGCRFREWTVTTPTEVHVKRDAASAVVFTLAEGEKVQGLTGAVFTLKPGRVVVKKATKVYKGNESIPVSLGDTLFALHHTREGGYLLWYRGKLVGAGLPEHEDEFFRVESNAESVWWVQVKNARGQVGWTDQADHFEGMDEFAKSGLRPCNRGAA